MEQLIDNNKKTQRDGMMRISFINKLLFKITKFFLSMISISILILINLVFFI